MPPERVLIVRHGQTDYNIARRWQGQLDIPLNKQGKQQAQALAEYLRDTSIDVMYASDLSRAFHTAEIIAEGRNLTIQPEPRLREFKLGVLEGLSRTEINDRHQDVLDQWNVDDHYIVPNGESRILTQQRVLSFWNEVVLTAQEKTVTVVTHGGTTRMLLQRILGDQIANIRFHNTSLTILEPKGKESWHAVALNITPHLSDDQR